MLIVSYDIHDGKVRTLLSKTLQKNGAIRLQNSVYEVNYSETDNNKIRGIVESDFLMLLEDGDSIIIFNVENESVEKFGDSIHRDEDIVYL